MDVREIAIWHRGAQIILLERKIERLFHLRIAQTEDHNQYSNEVRRLESYLEPLFGASGVQTPKTPEECKQARLQFAKALGLKILKKL